MSDKTPFWKQPQNYIIAILLMGIAGYIGYQQLQPKTNKLAQASAYFDAQEAEERAEAEKKRAAFELEKAQLALEAAEKAKAEAEEAKTALAVKQLRDAIQSSTQQEQVAQPDYWYFNNVTYCGDGDYFICEVICSNPSRGDTTKAIWITRYESGGWGGGNVDGIFDSQQAVFQAECQRL